MTEPPKTYSIMLRVRRVVYEDAYVSVPVTGAIMARREDGTFGIDTQAFYAEALRTSQDPRVEWRVEEFQVEPHPLQAPKPDDRRSLDAFYDMPGARQAD